MNPTNALVMTSARVKNSQAMRDWVRAARDLQFAESEGAGPEAVRDAAHVLERAAERLRAIAQSRAGSATQSPG